MSSGPLTEHAWGQSKESAKGMSNQTSCEWHHSDLWMGIICFLSEKLGGIFNLRASWSQLQFCLPQICFFFFFIKVTSPPPKEIEFLNCLSGCWLLLVWFPFGLGGTKITHSYPGFVPSFCLIPSALPPSGHTVKVGPLCLSPMSLKIWLPDEAGSLYHPPCQEYTRHLPHFAPAVLFPPLTPPSLTCLTHSESQGSSLSPMYSNGAVFFCFCLDSITWHSTWIQLVWTFYL